jgi:hypothetical protein
MDRATGGPSSSSESGLNSLYFRMAYLTNPLETARSAPPSVGQTMSDLDMHPRCGKACQPSPTTHAARGKHETKSGADRDAVVREDAHRIGDAGLVLACPLQVRKEDLHRVRRRGCSLHSSIRCPLRRRPGFTNRCRRRGRLDSRGRTLSASSCDGHCQARTRQGRQNA